MSPLTSTILGIMIFCGLGYGDFRLILWLIGHVPPDIAWIFWANLGITVGVIFLTIRPIIWLSVFLGGLCYAIMEEHI